MRTSRCAGVLAGALALTLACGSAAIAVSDPGFGRDRDTVLICHRTPSLAQPYELVRVQKNSRQFSRHLTHRYHTDGNGLRDLVDGQDGRIRSLKDCPSEWDYTPNRHEGFNESFTRDRNRKSRKLKQRQGQNLEIYLHEYEHAGRASKGRKRPYQTYRPRHVMPGHKPRRPGRVLPRGVKPKGTVGR